MIVAQTALHLPDLDEDTRGWMLQEWEAEERSGHPFRSARMTPAGIAASVEVMPEVLRAGNERTLAAALAYWEYWKPAGVHMRRGKMVVATTPRDAHLSFATTEFLTWYVRGVARRLLEEGQESCQIYRAAPAWIPRCECRRLEGTVVETRRVYEGHRARYWPVKNSRAFSVPVGTNCHHAVTRVAA